MNTSAASLSVNDSHLCISGDIDFTNVMSLYAESLRLLSTRSSFAFDFSGVKASNSAGLALIIEWLRLAQAKKIQPTFKNIPQNLLSIAKAANLDTLLA